MHIKFKKLITTVNVKFLSSLATFALLITTVASNQRCWYIMYEEELPKGHKDLQKF